MKAQRPTIIYVSDASREAMRRALDTAAKEYSAAKEAVEASAEDVAERQTILLAVIDRFRQAVVEGQPI